MNADKDLVLVMVAVAVSVLAAAFVAVRNATRGGPREVTAARAHIHQRAPQARVMFALGAAVLGGVLAVYLQESGMRRDSASGGPARSADSAIGAPVLPAESDDGPWLAIAVAAGAVTVGIGAIVLFRAQNTRN